MLREEVESKQPPLPEPAPAPAPVVPLPPADEAFGFAAKETYLNVWVDVPF